MTDGTSHHPFLGGAQPGDAPIPLIAKEPSREGYPDAVWRPRSADLVTELGVLAAELRPLGLEVRRVVYNPELWGRAPRRAVIGSRQTDLGTSRAFHPHLVRLFLTQGRPWVDLLVLLPTGPELRPGTPVLSPPLPEWRDLTAEQVWEPEGSHFLHQRDTSKGA